MPKEKKVCLEHSTPLTYNRKHKMWFCKTCLYGSFLTHQTQQAAVKRYRQSDKGKAAEKKYEQSEKGKTARERYLKSDKYKQRRKEYNQRLKESLQIARLAHREITTKETPAEERKGDKLQDLARELRRFYDFRGILPTTTKIIEWAKADYDITMTPAEVDELRNMVYTRSYRHTQKANENHIL